MIPPQPCDKEKLDGERNLQGHAAVAGNNGVVMAYVFKTMYVM
jgi:hypothetical protein